MPRVIKITDITLGHSDPASVCPGVNPLTIIPTNVSAEGVSICVVGDIFYPHPNILMSNHVTTIATPLPPAPAGTTIVPNVFAGGILIATEGGTLACGDLMALNSANLIATQVYIN